MPYRRPELTVFFLLLTWLLPSACTVTGPADDGWENYNEWVDNGRLLADETKTVYRGSEPQPASASRDAGLDFDAYQHWRKARESNSAEYQRFRQWQEFEAFDRWKQEQGAD